MRYSTKLFTFTDRTFVSEASTLQFDPEQMDRIYADACDEGFTMESHVTGDEVKFVFRECTQDEEGDIIAYVFDVDQYAVARNPKLARVQAHILND